MTKGSIIKGLVGLAVPIIITNFIQTAYSMIDMIWIGKLGSKAVAAVGTAGFFVNMAFALFALIVTGSGIRIAQSVGAKKDEETNALISNAFIMSFVLAILYSIIIIIFRNSIIGFFNLGSKQVEKMASDYLITSMVGVLFMYSNTIFVSIFNSFGNSKLPFKINTIGFLLNIVLDPLLIFGFSGMNGLGVFGAALATIISRIVVFILFYLKSRKYFEIFESGIIINNKKLYDVLKLGTPYALRRVTFTIISIFLAKIISSWGATAIAVQKVGVQIEALSYMTIGGLHGAMSAFVGQNYGATKLERIKQGYKVALIMSATFGIITTTVFVLFPEKIFSVFLDEPESVVMGANYLRIIGYSQIFMCIEIISMAAFNGLGKTFIPSMVGITFTSLRIPMALIITSYTWLDLNGVWLTISISSMFKGLILMIWVIVYLKYKLDGDSNNIKAS